MKAFPRNLAKGQIIKDEGMDLRDYFAIHATNEDIQPFIKNLIEYYERSGKGYYEHQLRSRARYQFAGQMMEARND